MEKEQGAWIRSILASSADELYLSWTMLFIMVLIRPASYDLIKFSGAFHLKCLQSLSTSFLTPSLVAHTHTQKFIQGHVRNAAYTYGVCVCEVQVEKQKHISFMSSSSSVRDWIRKWK